MAGGWGERDKGGGAEEREEERRKKWRRGGEGERERFLRKTNKQTNTQKLTQCSLTPTPLKWQASWV